MKKLGGNSISEMCWWFWLPLESFYYKKKDELRRLLAGLQAEMRERREGPRIWVLGFEQIPTKT